MKALHHGKHWSKEDDELLMDLLGTTSLARIGVLLRRSRKAVIGRLFILGINFKDEAGCYRTYEFAELVGVDPSTVRSWIKNKGLPAHQFYKIRKEKGKNRYYYIFPSDFWKWADKNRDIVNFKRIKREALYPEPPWLEEAIRSEKKGSRDKLDWTLGEEKRLFHLIVNEGYTYQEAAQKLGRMKRAVYNRIQIMINEDRWPSLKRGTNRWLPEEEEELIRLRSKGYTMSEIAKKLGRSRNSVDCKILKLRKMGRLEIDCEQTG